MISFVPAPVFDFPWRLHTESSPEICLRLFLVLFSIDSLYFKLMILHQFSLNNQYPLFCYNTPILNKVQKPHPDYEVRFCYAYLLYYFLPKSFAKKSLIALMILWNQLSDSSASGTSKSTSGSMPIAPISI